MTHIAVVIPMFNAEDHIATVLRGIPPLVSTVVVVDDASTDQSLQQARSVADPRIVLVLHSRNCGVGAATLSGYRRAATMGAQIIVKMDADDQMDPAYLGRLIGPIVAGRADYTKGNRFLHARSLRAMPLLRRFGNLGLSFMTKLASGYWTVFDPTNGYTAIHASLLPWLHDDHLAKRYFFESSMLAELSLLRAAVRDVAIPARYGHEVSSLSQGWALVSFPPRLVAAFVRRLWIQYFLRDFGLTTIFLLAGSAMLVFGVLFGAFHWVRSAQQHLSTPTGTVMLAVLPVILGVQFLLQALLMDVQNVPTEIVSDELIQDAQLSGTPGPWPPTSQPRRAQPAG